MREMLSVIVVLDANAQADHLIQALGVTASEVKAAIVSSARALTDALDKMRPDLVLGHCGIPALSCDEVLAIVREKSPGIATVLMAAGFDEEHAIRLIASGVDELLSTIHPSGIRWAAERALAQARKRHPDRGLASHAHSEGVLAAIVESAEDAIVGKTLDGIVRTWSPGAERIFGYAPSEIIGKPITLLLPPDRVDEERMIIARVERGERVECYESRRLRKDGTEIDVSLTISPIRSADGAIIGASKIARDITRQLATARRERRQMALYSALSQTNQALVRARDPVSLYEEICRVCVEHGGVVLAFVVIVHDGSAHPVASAGYAGDYLNGLTIRLSADCPEGRGPVAAAVRRRVPYICNDFQADPATVPWRERAAALGTQATASIPFQRGGRVEGVLVLHVGEKNFFDEPLVRLLREMADDVSFALDNLDQETARIETELALRRSEASLASAQQRAMLGNFDVDVASGLARWSLQMFRLFDLDAAHGAPQLAQIFELIHEEDSAKYRAAYEQALQVGTASNFEIRRRSAGEQQRWLHVNLQGCHDGDGKVVSVSGTVQDVSERKLSELRILHLGTHDVLTDLPNRALMRDRITQALANARRTSRLAAVLFLDLDRFKFINDSYGHPFGDELILAAARRLSAVVRASDSVARTGGDEFLVLLVDLNKRVDVHVAVQKILECFRAPFDIDGRQVVVTASVGVSLFPHDGDDADTLIGNADTAMYRSKGDGRNTYQFFSAQMSEETRLRVQLEGELRHALERRQLSLVYQPKVDLKTGRIFGCEALVRWQHPELGAVSPARFIPIAEETGLIVPIGDWILREACRQNKAWQDAGLPPIVVSINLSTRQFRQQDVTEWVRDVLVDADLDPGMIELELTESLIAEDMEGVVGAIKELQLMGVKLSIDDFGTGFSSLAYLKRFRVNTLKIDQSFIRNLMTEPDDATIALAIIALAHSLRLSVIAEGVETMEQCEALRANGCDAIQGYLFSRPVPPEQMARMLLDEVGLEIPEVR